MDGYSWDVLKKGNRAFQRLCAAQTCQLGMKPLVEGNWYHLSVVFLSGRAAAANNFDWCGVRFYIDGEEDYAALYPGSNPIPLIPSSCFLRYRSRAKKRQAS